MRRVRVFCPGDAFFDSNFELMTSVGQLLCLIVDDEDRVLKTVVSLPGGEIRLCEGRIAVPKNAHRPFTDEEVNLLFTVTDSLIVVNKKTGYRERVYHHIRFGEKDDADNHCFTFLVGSPGYCTSKHMLENYLTYDGQPFGVRTKKS